MKFRDTMYGDLSKICKENPASIGGGSSSGQHYNGNIDVSLMKLTSLEGSPKEVG